MRTGVLAVAGWLATATLAFGASMAAMSVVRGAVAPQQLATGLPTPDEPTGAGTPSSRPSSTPGSTASRGTAPSRPATPTAGRAVPTTGTGGSVVVRCVGGSPVFVNVVPQQGFWVERDDSSAEVKFRSGTHRTEIKADCAGGTPRTSVEEKDSGADGGGNSGRGGGEDD